MQDDPIAHAKALGLARAAELFPDTLREAAASAQRMRTGFARELPLVAEPALILPPPGAPAR